VEPSTENRGLTTFLTLWAGQVVSLLGSNLTGFALGVWVYQRTGSTTQFALIFFLTSLPGLLLAPLAGVLVDRWNRRVSLLVSDAGAGLATLIAALLLWNGELEVWHVYVLRTANAAFGVLQWPAFSAAATQLVPKRHLVRASGLVQAGTATAEILAPLLAGILMVRIGLSQVLWIDFATFGFAVLTQLFVRIPSVPRRETLGGEGTRPSVRREALAGWSFLRAHRGLLALLLLFASAHLALGMMQALVTPMVLGFAKPEVLGSVLTAAGIGMLLGALTMSVWGGPRHRVACILAVLALQGALLIAGGLRPNALLVGAAAFSFTFAMQVLNSTNQGLWQTKVPLDLQGRVFALRRMVSWSTLPLAYLVAGPLAEWVFEPLLAPGGPLADSVGKVLGVGEGRGIALLFGALGTVLLALVAVASRHRALRRLETEVPDALPNEVGPEATPLPGAASEN
jgi:DHA3 family macrolide efflux protein-like MFS transporter